jgi:hypothetical protein
MTTSPSEPGAEPGGGPASAGAPVTAPRRARLVMLVVLLVVAGLAVAAWLLMRDRGEVRSDAGRAQAVGAARPAGLRALPEAEQLALAGAAAFGLAGDTRVLIAPDDDADESDGIEDRVSFTPGRLLWTGFGPVLISEGEVIEPGHVSAGRIAVHYLREDGAKFALVKDHLQAVVTGSFGRVGEWRVMDDLMPHPVIYTTGGGTWQGYSCSWGILTELSPSGPREIGRFALSYSDDGAIEDGPTQTIEGALANIVKGRSFDIVYAGSKRFTEHYELKDRRFVLVGGKSRMETC